VLPGRWSGSLSELSESIWQRFEQRIEHTGGNLAINNDCIECHRHHLAETAYAQHRMERSDQQQIAQLISQSTILDHDFVVTKANKDSNPTRSRQQCSAFDQI